jgi:hypothetical protein
MSIQQNANDDIGFIHIFLGKTLPSKSWKKRVYDQ